MNQRKQAGSTLRIEHEPTFVSLFAQKTKKQQGNFVFFALSWAFPFLRRHCCLFAISFGLSQLFNLL